MNAKVEFAAPRPKPLLGVKDGGHVQLKCSNCNRLLVDLAVNQPGKLIPGTNTPFKWRVRAKCCFCKERPEYSFIETVFGLYSLGCAGKVNPDDPEDSTVETAVVNILNENDSEGKPIVTFVTVEEKKK